MSYAEVKAIASGNPAVLTLAEADAELQRLTLLKKYHLDEQYLARRSVRDLPGTITMLTERLKSFTADLATLTKHAEDLVTIAGDECPREAQVSILGRHLDNLPMNVRQEKRIGLGLFRGLRFGVVLHPQWPADVYLEGAAVRQSGLFKEHQGPRAVLNALDRLANGYALECSRIEQDLAIAQSQLRDYQARLGKAFPHDEYLAALTDLRDALRSALSGMNPEAKTPEIAAAIKTLKAANTVETAPERINRKRISAEEPVTARIRRRIEWALDQAPEDAA